MAEREGPGGPCLVRVNHKRLTGALAMDRRLREARPGMNLAALRNLGLHLGELRSLVNRDIVKMSGPLPPPRPWRERWHD